MSFRWRWLKQILALVEQPAALAQLADHLLRGVPVSLHVIVLLPSLGYRTLTGRCLQGGWVVAAGQPVGQLGDGDASRGGLAFGPLVAVDHTLARYGKGPAQLDEPGPEVTIQDIEAELESLNPVAATTASLLAGKALGDQVGRTETDACLAWQRAAGAIGLHQPRPKRTVSDS
jgi:hypothetical protein